MNNGVMNGDVYEDSDQFSTCDLYLASFFISAGNKLISSSRDVTTRRVYFVFEKNPILVELKLKYFSREAKIDALTYADNIKSLKSLCHNIATNTMVPRP